MSYKNALTSVRAKLSGVKRRLSAESSATTTEELALIQKNYLTAEELSRLKTRELTTSTLMGKTVHMTDSFWYLHSLKEIFVEETYRFRATTPTPYILDCGANIGLSAIYFKRLYPRAKVVAFEPDPHIGGLLRSNLSTFGFSDVVIENKAIWREETVLKFAAAGSLGGKIEESNGSEKATAKTSLISVPAVNLKLLLRDQVDFLKMDIEGAEVEVLESCSENLGNVQNLFVEYHSTAKSEQRLDVLLGILKKAGFRVYIKEAWNNLPFPFLRTDYNPCYDLQLNVFAYRH